jgi:hypothetical protein
MTPVSPNLNSNLSDSSTSEAEWLIPAGTVFQNHVSSSQSSLGQIEAALAIARAEHESRSRKAAALTAMIENLEAVRHLTNAYAGNFSILLNKLDAETAMRDRLLLAISGLERALAWRQSKTTKE